MISKSCSIILRLLDAILSELPDGVELVIAAKTRKIYDKIKKLDLPNIEMRYLSMGMTSSYQIAIEEGANIVRIGAKIFGEKSYQGK